MAFNAVVRGTVLNPLVSLKTTWGISSSSVPVWSLVPVPAPEWGTQEPHIKWHMEGETESDVTPGKFKELFQRVLHDVPFCCDSFGDGYDINFDPELYAEVDRIRDTWGQPIDAPNGRFKSFVGLSVDTKVNVTYKGEIGDPRDLSYGHGQKDKHLPARVFDTLSGDGTVLPASAVADRVAGYKDHTFLQSEHQDILNKPALHGGLLEFLAGGPARYDRAWLAAVAAQVDDSGGLDALDRAFGV